MSSIYRTVAHFSMQMITALLLFSSLCLPLHAQVLTMSLPTTPVQPGSGHAYLEDLAETINPANGSVSIRVTAPVPADRGFPHVVYAFTYDSSAQYAVQMNPQYDNTEACNTGNFSIYPHAFRCIRTVLGPFRQKPVTVDGADVANRGPNTATASRGSFTFVEHSGGPHITCYYARGVVYEDDYGNHHPLNIQATSDTATVNNCSYVFDLTDSSVGGDADFKIVWNPLGKHYLNFSAIADLHGNVAPFTYDVSQQLLFEDSNGNYRNALGRSGTPYGFNADRYLHASPVGANVATSYSTTFPGLGEYKYQEVATSSSYVLTGRDIFYGSPTQSVCSGFGTGTSLSGTSSSGNAANGIAISAMTLPNGLSYTFQYDGVYGLLTRMTYPTGAWVEYTWADNLDSEGGGFDVSGSGYVDPVVQPSPGSNITLSCRYRHSYPALKTRRVSYDGSAVALQQDFAYSTVWSSDNDVFWTAKSTTQTTTDLIRLGHPKSTVVYTYVPRGIHSSVGDAMMYSPNAFEDIITYKNSDGTVAHSLKKTWNLDNQLLGECTILDDGQVSGRFYKYQGYTWNNAYGTSPTMHLTNLISDVSEYDYGVVTADCLQPESTPDRETLTDYASFANTPLWPEFTVPDAFGPTTSSPMSDRPSRVRIMYHGTVAKETDYEYDKSDMQAVDSPLGHDDSNYGIGNTIARGNATKITEKCYLGSDACKDAISYITYDITGQPVSVKDPKGNTTLYSYSDSYVDDDNSNSGNTNAYVTKITRPTVNMVANTSSYKYGYISGALRQITDANKQKWDYKYNSSFNRLTEVDAPDSGVKTITYNDDGPNPSIVTTVVKDSAGVTEESAATTDAYGHTIQTKIKVGVASDDYVYVDLAYDGLGLPLSVSNPYKMTTESTYGKTSYTYDVMGRKILQLQPDNITTTTVDNEQKTHYSYSRAQQWSYTGNTITFTDEKGSQWKRANDALSRLTNVSEPGGLQTSYSYDGLGNLLAVAQTGVSSDQQRTRRFTYNSLSQLTCASNPENGKDTCVADANGNLPQGVTAYSYDENGNVKSKTDARSITTNYSYDALNRLLSKTYTSSSGTPSSCYQYDASSIAGASGNLVGRLTNSWTQAGVCASKPPAGSATFSRRSILSYDAMGRVLSEQQCTRVTCGTNAVYTPTYDYDLVGNMIHHSNGIGTLSFTNCYNGANQLSLVVAANTPCDALTSPASANLFSSPSYSPAGGLTSALFGSGLHLARTYDSRLRISTETDIGSPIPSALPGAATLTITGTEQKH